MSSFTFSKYSVLTNIRFFSLHLICHEPLDNLVRCVLGCFVMVDIHSSGFFSEYIAFVNCFFLVSYDIFFKNVAGHRYMEQCCQCGKQHCCWLLVEAKVFLFFIVSLNVLFCFCCRYSSLFCSCFCRSNCTCHCSYSLFVELFIVSPFENMRKLPCLLCLIVTSLFSFFLSFVCYFLFVLLVGVKFVEYFRFDLNQN
jgi:hypothetical protein